MKAQFIVTIEGKWLQGDRWATQADAEKMLREAVGNQFGFLADRTSVKRLKNEAAPASKDAQDAKRYHALRRNVAPADVAESMDLPCPDLRNDESIEECIDALCDAYIAKDAP